MILRDLPNGDTLVIPQPCHARASGRLAELLRPAYYEAGEREGVIQGVNNHDIAWESWERHPRRHDSGRPLAFDELPADEHGELWLEGVSAARTRVGPRTSALIAMLAQSVGGDLGGREEQFAALKATSTREAWPDLDPVQREWRLERAFAVLQLCDLLTLCPTAGWKGPYSCPLVDDDGRHAEITFGLMDEWTVEVGNWPFSTPSPIYAPVSGTTRKSSESWDTALERLRQGRTQEYALTFTRG